METYQLGALIDHLETCSESYKWETLAQVLRGICLAQGIDLATEVEAEEE